LIELTQKAYATAKPNALGVLRTRVKRRLAMSVSSSTYDRALLVMDTLLKAMEAEGLEPKIAKRGGPTSFVVVREEMIEFSITEVQESREHKPTADEKRRQKADQFFTYPSHDRFLTGRLRLSIDNVPGGPKKSWTDGKRWIVEDVIDAFLRTLDKAADRVKEIREEEAQRQREQEEWNRRYEEERAREQVRAREIEEEKQRIRLLDRHLERMGKAEAIRVYADRMEKALTPERAELVRSHGAGGWLQWCRRYADRLDPTVAGTRFPVELNGSERRGSTSSHGWVQSHGPSEPDWFIEHKCGPEGSAE